MITRSAQLISLFTFLISFLSASVWAAKAPVSKKELEKEASHIVIGKILEVTSKIENSKIEKGAGNKDKVFSIRVQVKREKA